MSLDIQPDYIEIDEDKNTIKMIYAVGDVDSQPNYIEKVMDKAIDDFNCDELENFLKEKKFPASVDIEYRSGAHKDITDPDFNRVLRRYELIVTIKGESSIYDIKGMIEEEPQKFAEMVKDIDDKFMSNFEEVANAKEKKEISEEIESYLKDLGLGFKVDIV